MKSLENLQQKKLFLFDIDGTLSVGDALFPGSSKLLSHIESIGGKSFFITNNSTKSGADYVAKFRDVFHLETTDEQFVTAGFLTIQFLKQNFANELIFVMATASFTAELKRCGLRITSDPDARFSCILVAYDSELTYEKLALTSKALLTHDVPFYATNPDLRCPIDFGFIPDCGAICNMLTETTGKTPIYLGKPNAAIVEHCLAKSNFSKAETLVVGDRLYTDIACGINAGVDTCVLFTGEARPEEMETTEFPADYAFENVEALLAACQNSNASNS